MFFFGQKPDNDENNDFSSVTKQRNEMDKASQENMPGFTMFENSDCEKSNSSPFNFSFGSSSPKDKDRNMPFSLF